MYHPSLDEVKAMAGKGNLAPIYRSINADLETPVSAYLKIAHPPYSFLLESVSGGERIGRYSFIGTDPYRVIKTGPGQPGGQVDPLTLVQAEMDQYELIPVPGLPRFHGGAVGYLAYDTVSYFEPRVPVMPADPQGLPESVFTFVDTLLVFDHLRHDIKVVSHVHLNGDVRQSYAEAVQKIDQLVDLLYSPLDIPRNLGPSEVEDTESKITSNFTVQEFGAAVNRAEEHIIKGDIIQVVLSQRLSRRTSAHPFQIYRALRSVNPSPYMYFLDLGDFQIVGASIETVARAEDGIIATHPIAGTRPRGTTEEEDRELEAELTSSEKQRAEHIMLVDLGRNDIGRVSQPGTVQVTQLMDVERYSHVMHLVSHVEGKIKPDLTIYDLLRACFPAGTVSGAPKVRAMELISAIEGERRGPYGGAVGYFSFSGNLDTALTLRTAVIKDGIAHVQAGGGIVYDSTPEDEYQETLHKAGALLTAIDKAEGRP